ncbi:pyruvate, phosphate dikinase [Amylibacter sp. SFDW26]|uniref:putative PEP-binding protein n=1 Tax=Amylibacter sp. SFDW26 TaxID=2652722 RepID=UPI001261D80C|nr:putative PEP-binding protein [Amylibacter sp. SFDW26]KAB7615522.1 pyruvate, phosphate dikinase [Amylibacter sp. SFDW26]
MTDFPRIMALTAGTTAPKDVYGARAAAQVTLMDAGLPVPKAWGLSLDAVKAISNEDFPAEWPFLEELSTGCLVSVRASPVAREWGGPDALLNLGMNQATCDILKAPLGEEAAVALYARFVQDYSVKVARLDPEWFDELYILHTKNDKVDYEAVLGSSLALYDQNVGELFPQEPVRQLRKALRSFVKAWDGTTARILRMAQGAPEDAGLGLIIQEMALGLGRGESGAGIAQFVSSRTGEKKAHGRYLSQSQGREATDDQAKAHFLSKDKRGPSLEDVCPEAFETLRSYSAEARKACGDAMQLEFTVHDGAVAILDAVPAERSGRAAMAISVRLVEDGIKSKEDVLMGIDPRSMNEVLHPLVDPRADRQVITTGISSSPGAATGKIVFTANAAQASAAREEPCILVRIETTPEDVRGMHSAQAVLTAKGGRDSHAAVVARTIGVPCIVGVSDMKVDVRGKVLTLPNGVVLRAGDVITVDASEGEVLLGAPKLVQPNLGGAFNTFMTWADETRKLGVRANADTPQDARMARDFNVDGIGLVRTEHMFFEAGRLNVMRELIFADTDEDRQAALNLLLPMQRSDFIELFEIMQGLPVCIRLLDPPLHEFLPHSRDEMQSLADAMGLPLSKITARVEDLREFNPMLGTRGVRLGIMVPEIYNMQARAIFEAAVHVHKNGSDLISPEIMVPLVSANREVELVRASVDSVFSAVKNETGVQLSYTLGSMVETPRAALRAGEIARSSEFFSFGTNDLTQMTYGLSRDDSGRFMRDYVSHGVFEEDPFHSLDVDGVGELLLMACERGRAERKDLLLGLCGEHGGDPQSVWFCHKVGLNYVSCSPFRTPIAKLAAAQAAILDVKK